MIGYDLQAKEFVHKGENMDVKALGTDGSGKDSMGDRFPSVCCDDSCCSRNRSNALLFPTQVVQCYIVFDMIFLNGEPLYDKPLAERRRLLEKHIAEVPGRLLLAPQKVLDVLCCFCVLNDFSPNPGRPHHGRLSALCAALH